MKTIILSSYYEDALPWIANYLRKRNVKTIGLIIDAKKPSIKTEEVYIFKDAETLREAGFNVDLIDLEEDNPDDLEKVLSQYDVIYLKGGNTFYLLNSIIKSGFDKIIKKLVDKGIIYIGESAGSYVACPSIEMAHWKHQDRDIVGTEDLTGLNLVPFLVTVHYKKEFESLIKPHIEQCNYDVKILTDKELLLIEDDKETLIKL